MSALFYFNGAVYVSEAFSAKRSAHYNEYQKMKEAQAAGLLDSDEEEGENVS